MGVTIRSLGSDGLPIHSTPYSFPSNLAVSGSQGFYEAATINYKDPIVEEWNLTLERDLGKVVGLRVSYDGNPSLFFSAQAEREAPPLYSDLYTYDISKATTRNLSNGFAGTISSYQTPPIALARDRVAQLVSNGFDQTLAMWADAAKLPNCYACR